MPDTWVCVAGGPSLVAEDIQFCREQGWKLATCNMGFRLVPDAALFYAMDGKWWEAYHDELRETMNPDCKLYSGNYGAFCAYPGLSRITWNSDYGWSTTHGFVHGKQSGMGLLQAVSWEGPARIILLGYDYQYTGGRRHHHEDYPDDWKNVPNIGEHVPGFREIARQAPVPVINCSRETALDCFPRAALRAVPRGTIGTEYASAAA